MEVKIIAKEERFIPKYGTDGASGCDLVAAENAFIGPGQRILVKTGISLNIPTGYEAQVRSRSGLALKSGIIVLNGPGTIDSDYTGEIGVILWNSNVSAFEDLFEVKVGDRIAQLVFAKTERVEFVATEKLEETVRGDGGYGSTGVRTESGC